MTLIFWKQIAKKLKMLQWDWFQNIEGSLPRQHFMDSRINPFFWRWDLSYPGGQSWNVRHTNWEKWKLCLAGSHFYIWFVFYVSLPNEIKLLLFNIFFFDPIPDLDWNFSFILTYQISSLVRQEVVSPNVKWMLKCSAVIIKSELNEVFDEDGSLSSLLLSLFELKKLLLKIFWNVVHSIHLPSTVEL